MDGGHELLRRAAANPQVLQWHTWAALTPGPALVIMGAVHGNETCGAYAILRAIDDLQHGRLLLRRAVKFDRFGRESIGNKVHRRPGIDHSARRYNGDAIAETLGLIHVMGGDEDSCTRSA